MEVWSSLAAIILIEWGRFLFTAYGTDHAAFGQMPENLRLSGLNFTTRQ